MSLNVYPLLTLVAPIPLLRAAELPEFIESEPSAPIESGNGEPYNHDKSAD